MEITAALLCDFAQVREGLLFVSSGGITRVMRPEYPAPLGVVLALVVDLDPEEHGEQHRVRVRVIDAHDTVLWDGTAELGVGQVQAETGEHISLPLVVDLRPVALPADGVYRLEVDANGVLRQILRLRAIHVPLPPGGPGNERTVTTGVPPPGGYL
ncbi:MAG: hypothetical protein KJ056_02000 [Acidimicrobiia bacterium]|nr:hypothetical protein [Acidimicrobiia bacterium]MCL4291792.1 hypothetical protein [Acidimicrobiia bacterium]